MSTQSSAPGRTARHGAVTAVVCIGPVKRTKAVSTWAAVAGGAAILGVLGAGALLEFFSKPEAPDDRAGRISWLERSATTLVDRVMAGRCRTHPGPGEKAKGFGQ